MMGDLSENFDRREFRCVCGCGFDTADYALVTALEDVRSHFSTKYGKAFIEITGPNRCQKHNWEIGGAEDSQHQYGKAADFKVWTVWKQRQVAPGEVADYLEEKYTHSCGIGRYFNRTHFDVRNKKARWDDA